jgi:hypothetical protein
MAISLAKVFPKEASSHLRGSGGDAPHLCQSGVIAPFPNLTSLDVGTHKGLLQRSSMAREIKRLWQYRLVTTSLLMDLHQAHCHGLLGCIARRYFSKYLILQVKLLIDRFGLGMARSHPVSQSALTPDKEEKECARVSTLWL